jgi:hypothetical protein
MTRRHTQAAALAAASQTPHASLPARRDDAALVQRPLDYRTWITVTIIGGILFSILLGMPAGFIAQRRSRTAGSLLAAGDPAAALRASRSARRWVIAATVLDLLGIALFAVLVVSGHSAGGSQ